MNSEERPSSKTSPSSASSSQYLIVTASGTGALPESSACGACSPPTAVLSEPTEQATGRNPMITKGGKKEASRLDTRSLQTSAEINATDRAGDVQANREAAGCSGSISLDQ